MTQELWIYWNCNGRDEVSRVHNMGAGGLFLETGVQRAVGTPTKLDFLVSEGQIRADAVIRHVRPGQGLGVKFTALTEQDRGKFAVLMRRLRGLAVQ